jgi:DNA-binding NarL/FixJ family response regulator
MFQIPHFAHQYIMNSYPETIKLILADDQELFVEGLRALLSKYPEFEVIGCAKSGQEVIHMIPENKCDVLLLDINMPDMDGIQACHFLTKHYPDLQILMLSSYANKEFIADVMQSGANGYVVKNAGKEELITAIREIASGKRYVSPSLLGGQSQMPSVSLSQRELDVLKLIAEGYTAPEIAEKLCLSIHTIHTHRKNIQLKLGLKNQSLLVKYALERGLVN